MSAAEGGDALFHPVFRSDGWKKLQSKDNALSDSSDNDDTATVAFLHDEYFHFISRKISRKSLVTGFPFAPLVIDLLKDYARLKGTSVLSKIPDLLAILQRNYSLKNLQNFVESI